MSPSSVYSATYKDDEISQYSLEAANCFFNGEMFSNADTVKAVAVPLPASDDNCILFPLWLIFFFLKRQESKVTILKLFDKLWVEINFCGLF